MTSSDTCVLTLNAGSSSIKFALFDAGLRPLLRAAIEGLGGDAVFHADGGRTTPPLPAHADHAAAVAILLDWLEPADDLPAPTVIGHRVVHGGRDFAGPVRLDADARARIAALGPLAPQHQPNTLEVIDAVSARWPAMPQTASFDTAFHRTMPELARRYALPPGPDLDGIEAFGFHGLSYAYIASRLPELLPEDRRRRVIVAHLGHGASLCALENGRSIATTMGFTPLDGLVMGRRSGALDPGIVLHLIRACGWSADDVADLLGNRSGLLGVSGISADVRALLASDAPQARLALDLFAYRCAREIGSAAAALGGLDALVFTAGIGEHAAPVRASIVERCAWLGMAIDPAANAANAPRIGKGPGPEVLVVPTDEEQMIASEALAVLNA